MAIILFDDPFEFTTQDFIESVAGFVDEEDTESIDHILNEHTDEKIAAVFNELFEVNGDLADYDYDDLWDGPLFDACEGAVDILVVI